MDDVDPRRAALLDAIAGRQPSDTVRPGDIGLTAADIQAGAPWATRYDDLSGPYWYVWDLRGGAPP
jgi:hypothetical protein